MKQHRTLCLAQQYAMLLRRLLSQFDPFCFDIKYSFVQRRNQLFISGGGQFSWNFIRWRHRSHSTVVQLGTTFPQTVTCNNIFCPQTRSP